MSNPKLTERDKNNLTDEIRDKMVNTICSKIMDESASDSQLISGVLKKNLGDKINHILSNPSNEAKISETIFSSSKIICCFNGKSSGQFSWINVENLKSAILLESFTSFLLLRFSNIKSKDAQIASIAWRAFLGFVKYGSYTVV